MTPFRSVPIFLLALLLAQAGVSDLSAQSRPLDKARSQRADFLPEPAAPGISDETSASANDPGDDTPFGVDLTSLRLVAHQDQVDSKTTGGEQAIEIDPTLKAPAVLSTTLEPFLGKPLSMALLAELAKVVIEAWREEDFPIVDVYYPEQNITAGRVQVVVREALLGEVRINDVIHTIPDYLERNVRLFPGDRIDRRLLEGDLDWLNRNPIRQVNLIYERGEADGTSDIVLDTLEEKPISLYVGFANTGVPLTGENEWSAGFNWLNPFGREQTLGYQFGADLDFDHLESHTALYRAYLPWRHEFRFLGAAVVSDVPANGANLVGLEGENLQATFDYVIPLPRLREFRALRHELLFGLDTKSTNTDLIFGGLNAIASTAEIFQFRVAYEAAWRDKLGSNHFTLASIWSPGGVLDDNRDASFDALRAGATADYCYALAEIERSFNLPSSFELVLRGRGQITDDRLLSTEQLLAGGYLTVRGFDENLVRGDSGGLISAEIRTPSVPLLPTSLELRDEWRAFVFFDAAALDVSDPLPGEASPSLSSAGIGFTAQINESAFLRAAYGWVVDVHGIDERGMSDGRLHFGATVVY